MPSRNSLRRAAFVPEAFYPCYGLAEATLLVSGGRRGAGPAYAPVRSEALEVGRVELADIEDAGVRRLTACGSALPEHEVRIVDPETGSPVPQGAVGEIWVAGPSVAQGYWRKPAETRRRFQNHLPGREGAMLRTGDLGFLRDGELFVAGRRDDVMVIRGRNYFPEDLERSAAASHPALQPGSAMAFTIPDGGQPVLAIAAEWERGRQHSASASEAAENVRRAISEDYQLRVEKVMLAAPGALPRCANGKPQRHQCRRMFLEGRLEATKDTFAAPASAIADRTTQLIGWLREYTRSRINSQLMRERRCIPPHIVLDFGNQGLLGLQVPEALGGIGLSSAGIVRVLEQLAAIDLTLGAFVGVHNALGIRPILHYAPESLRSAILPDIARGRELAAFAITESGAGSNPQAIASTATPLAPGVWSLRGRKIWIGTGSWAGTVNVFTQLLDEESRRIGITGFVARHDDAGFRSGPEALTMGMRAMVQNQILLEGVVLDRGRMLGQPGNGMQVAQDAMMFGRFGLAALSLGGMKRCAQLMLRYARRRTVSAGLLLETPAAIDRLTRLTASIAALESLVQQLAGMLDSGQTVPAEAFLACKILGPEFLWHAADDLVQMLGGRGYIEPNLVPGILEDARLFRIFEGPTEALCEHLGAQAIHHPEALRSFLSDTLGAPGIWTELHGAAHELWDRRAGSASWAHYLVGQLAAFAMLDASARKSPIAAGGRAAAWTKIRFDELLRSARESAPYRAELDPAGLPDTIEAYGQTIGDVEQNLPGADYELDPMLRRDETAHRPAPPASTEEPARGSTTVDSWIRAWMARRMSVIPGNIDPAKPLTAYGMDSLLALEMATDLSEFLGIQLPDNVAFAYPTISELEAFLNAELKRRPAAVPS